jgi:hypothetical protein
LEYYTLERLVVYPPKGSKDKPYVEFKDDICRFLKVSWKPLCLVADKTVDGLLSPQAVQQDPHGQNVIYQILKQQIPPEVIDLCHEEKPDEENLEEKVLPVVRPDGQPFTTPVTASKTAANNPASSARSTRSKLSLESVKLGDLSKTVGEELKKAAKAGGEQSGDDEEDSEPPTPLRNIELPPLPLASKKRTGRTLPTQSQAKKGSKEDAAASIKNVLQKFSENLQRIEESTSSQPAESQPADEDNKALSELADKALKAIGDNFDEQLKGIVDKYKNDLSKQKEDEAIQRRNKILGYIELKEKSQSLRMVYLLTQRMRKKWKVIHRRKNRLLNQSLV